jgi:hypothetical protein
MKKTHLFFAFLFILGSLSGQEKAGNYFLESWVPKTFEKPDKSILIKNQEGDADVKIQLFPEDTIAPFLPVQLGLNATVRSGSDMVKKRLDLYRKSNMGAYRFPLGSGSNLYFWDGKIPEKFLIDINPINAKSPGFMQPEEFVVFIDSLDAQATVVVNYFYARYGLTPSGTRESKVEQAAEYAAGFVDYMNHTLRAGIKNWEIGNECYGSWEAGYDLNGKIITGKEYGEDFCVFAEKMKAVDPTIKVGAVMYPKSDEWNNQVMQEVKNHADFLVVHNYFTSEAEATMENILAGTPQVDEIKKQMEMCIVRNTGHSPDYYPVCMTEYNCRGPHTTTFINACFTADVIGRLVKNQYGLSTRWVGEWKWRQGTHGLFAVDDPDQKDYSVRQPYMIYHYFGKCFGDYMVNSACSDQRLTVYSSVFSDHKKSLVVINPTGEDIRFNISTDSKGTAFTYEVYAQSISETDKKFYVNDLTSETPGGGPDDPGEIPAYRIRYNGNTIFESKKYSVSFIVLDEK